MSFGLPPGEQFLGYPVAGPDNDLRPGHRRYNVVWYRPADEATKLQWLLTDERGVTHAISIPPPLIRREAIAEMRADAERLLAPQFRAGGAADRRADPAADLRSGIAAHGVRPRRDRGRCGLCCAAACRRRRFQGGGRCSRAGRRHCRKSRTSRARSSAIEAARFSRELPHHRTRAPPRRLSAGDAAPQEEQARAGRHSTDAAVIAETAVLDFLYALDGRLSCRA